MFSGLIQHQVPVGTNKLGKFSILAPKAKYQLGESISVNGVCLSVIKINPKSTSIELWFDLTPETLVRSNLKNLKPSHLVNFERSLTMNSFLGGHLVQGHVDGIGSVKKIIPQGPNKEIWFTGPKNILKYVVYKGSVTVNGVSLTAAKVKPGAFSVALIPVTLRDTNLGKLKIGDVVNLEADVMAKYVERFIKK